MKSFLTNAALLAVALLAVALVMDKALDASEREDCWRVRRQVAQGYPVTLPEWCEGK